MKRRKNKPQSAGEKNKRMPISREEPLDDTSKLRLTDLPANVIEHIVMYFSTYDSLLKLCATNTLLREEVCRTVKISKMDITLNWNAFLCGENITLPPSNMFAKSIIQLRFIQTANTQHELNIGNNREYMRRFMTLHTGLKAVCFQLLSFQFIHGILAHMRSNNILGNSLCHLNEITFYITDPNFKIEEFKL